MFRCSTVWTQSAPPPPNHLSCDNSVVGAAFCIFRGSKNNMVISCAQEKVRTDFTKQVAFYRVHKLKYFPAGDICVEPNKRNVVAFKLPEIFEHPEADEPLISGPAVNMTSVPREQGRLHCNQARCPPAPWLSLEPTTTEHCSTIAIHS